MLSKKAILKIIAALVVTNSFVTLLPSNNVMVKAVSENEVMGKQLELVPEELRKNVMCYLPFDEDFEDKSGNIDVKYDDKSNEGGSEITIKEGKNGNAAYFNGTGSSIGTGKNSTLNLGNIDYGEGENTKNFSYAFWVKSSNKSPDPTLVSNKDWLSGSNLGFCVSDTNGGLKFNFTAKGTSRIDTNVSNFTSNTDWQYVVIVADRVNGKYSIYVDGSLKAEDLREDTALKSINTNLTTRIGADGKEQYGFVGAMDSFVMFNKALDKREVRELSKKNGVNFANASMEYETSVSTEKEIINAGETVDVKLNVDNITGINKENFSAELMIDGDAEIIGDAKKTMLSIDVNENVEFSWKVKGNSGGSRFYIKVTDGENKPVELNAYGVTVKGAGWFAGDDHTHSRYSDGSGTILNNFDANRKRGINYITITDHSNSKGWEDALKADSDNMLVIRGNEYSSSKGHAVVMNVNEDKNYSNMSKVDLVNYIKESTNGTGLIYAAHPFENYPQYSEEDWNCGMNGLEVWNGWWGARQKFNADAFAKWDELNRAGKKMYGLTDTDAHSPNDIGKSFVCTYAEDLTTEAILDGQRAGHMYGTNGPEISFSIDNKIMGDDLGVKKDGETVAINMTGSYHKNLNKVILIKNGERVYTENIVGNSFNITKELDVKPGDFVRMEVEGFEEDGLTLDSPTFDSAPFAYSNPIFIEDEATMNEVIVKDIDNVKGKEGEEITLPVNLSNIPNNNGAKSLEVVVDIPSDLEVSKVDFKSSDIKAESFDYNEDEGKLRIALTNTSGEALQFNQVEETIHFADIICKLKENKEEGDSTKISIEALTFRCEENVDIEYDVSKAVSKISFVDRKEAKAVARKLYSSENEIIPENKKAVAIEFVNIPENVDIKYENNITLYFNKDLTEKNGKVTYVALVDENISLEDMSKMENYNLFESQNVNSVNFGDINNDGVDAQDALAAVSTWLRKTDVTEKDMITLNVSGDGKINTRDNIEITDYYVNGKEFSITNK